MDPPIADVIDEEDEEDEAGVIDEFQLSMSFSCVSVVHAELHVLNCVHMEPVFTVSHHMCAEAVPLRIRDDGMIPLSMDPLTDYGNW